jgi:hypothetical protein
LLQRRHDPPVEGTKAIGVLRQFDLTWRVGEGFRPEAGARLRMA